MLKIDASIEMPMQWLLDSLELEAIPRTIIYATSIKQVSDLYNYCALKKLQISIK